MGGEILTLLGLTAIVFLVMAFGIYYIVKKVLKGPNVLLAELMEEWFEREEKRTSLEVDPDEPIEPKDETHLSDIVEEKAERAKSGMPVKKTPPTDSQSAPAANEPTASSSASDAPATDGRPFLRKHHPDDHDANSNPQNST